MKIAQVAYSSGSAYFLAILLLGISKAPVVGNGDCYSKMNKIGTSYYIECNDTTCDNGTECKPQRSQVGSTYYFQCFCETGSVPPCYGVMVSSNPGATDPGYDVTCTEQPACPDPTPDCDEEQLDSDSGTYEQLCKCKSL